MDQAFDCVEMKRQAQDRIRESLRGMTREKKLAYWAEQSKRLAESRAQGDRKNSA